MPVPNLTCMAHLALLPARGVIEVAGDDRVSFLQGLVSNDVTEVAPGRAVWSALLTPQGRWLADFFIFTDGARLLLDCERAQIPLLLQRLGRFRLRSKVVLRDISIEFAVYVAWGEAPGSGPLLASDPRLAEAGWRLLSTRKLTVSATEADYDRHRLVLGLPDGLRDLEPEKTLLLEAGFDELHGVSWSKGCYMGQELTARTKYRALLKRRLVPVLVDGPLPSPGTPALRGSAEVGTMRSGRDERGLAVLRLEALSDALSCGSATITAQIPSWMKLAATAAS
jgi:tRNA-modifying protein YgfZ